MEIVELRVQVEDSQLKKLQADVQALKGTTINLGAGGGGGGKGSDPTAATRAGLKATEQQATKTGQSILSVMGKVAKWTAVTTAVYAPIHAFKEAVKTLKEVDSQLVQVQKVTDFSERQMKSIEQQAYKTASAYGVSADKYLESVTAFARAGYKEQSEQLAELSVKAQLVGDTTAEVANQFLLSTDAAYQYQGNIEQLTRILDGANEIDNKYATSIEKIAEGMGLVAPVAAQAHVGVDELMASIGTITAVTQRSGSETARALRALFLNIMGDTKTEIDEGVTWTTGEIAGLQDVLRKFAPDVVKAAEATKSVINPMEAMNALAKAMKEGALTEQDLMEMVSDIGGKLRSSQLLALIQNWDMYESMLSDFQKAAGSADREIENAMNSWERKTEVLKNTWTEFVSHLVDTDMVKGGLDAVTGFVEFLDSGMGEAAIKAGAVALALTGVGKAVSGIATAIKGTELLNFFASFSDIAKGQGVLTALSQTLGMIGSALGPLGIALAGIAAIVATPAIVDFFTTDYAEQGEKVSQLTSEYESLYGAESEYQQLVQKRSSDTGLSDWEQSRLSYLEQYRGELKATIEAEKEVAAQKYQEQFGAHAQSTFDEEYYRNGGRGKRDNETVDVKNLREAKKAFQELNEAASAGQKSQLEYQQGIDDILSSYEDFYEATKQGLEEGWLDTNDLTKAQQELMDLYETMMKLRDVPLDKLNVATAIENFKAISEVGDKSVVNWQKLKKAMEDAGATSEEVEATLASMQQDESIILIDVEADGVDGTLEKLEELGLAVETADGMEINIDGLTNLLTELGFSKDQVIELVNELGKVNGVSFVDAEGQMANLATATANAGSAAATVIDKIQKKADALGKTKPVVKMTAQDGVSKVADAAKKAVNSIPRSVFVSITASAGPVLAAVSTAKAALSTFSAFKAKVGLASGSQNWKGGPVLLGDEHSSDGSPRPELVITKGGKAFVAGMAGPTMADLPAGSRVYPYSDTMGILSGRDMMEVQAFSAGNDKILQHYLNPVAPKAGGGGGGANNGGNNQAKNAGGGNNANNANAGGGNKNAKGGGKGGGGGNGGGNGKTAKEEEDEYLEQLRKELELLKAQYSYLEASGASTEELNGKSGEIQNKLHEINERLRETGGEEKDIVDNSTDWWQELDKIRKVTQQIFEDERDLLETESELMEKQGKSATERIAKLRQIQDNLHREAEYLRSIKADQAEINRLSIKWWEIQNDILAVQQALMDELDAAISKELRDAQKTRDSELSYLDAKIKKLQEERDVQEEQIDLEERRKRVEEARFALENAQNQRSVRYFNAATGQWEWAADSKNVKSAEEALKQAQKDLQQTEKDKSYDLAIKAIEAQKEEVNARYNALESRWEALSDSFADPLRDIKDILRDLLATGKLTDDQVKLIKSLVGDIEDYTQSILDALTFKQYMTENPTGSVDDYLALRTGNQNAGSGFSDSLKEFFAENPDIPWSYTDSNGITYNSDGTTEYATSTTGTEKSTVTTGAKAKVTGSSSSSSSSSSKSSTSTQKKSTSSLSSKYSTRFDSGGVLSGYGGIKATGEDEIVIPPEIAGFMLKPSANHQFRQRMSELGYLYGTGSLASANVAGISQNKASSDHYGDIYQYGNITLSESQAKAMTVYELAQKSRGLSVYAGM